VVPGQWDAWFVAMVEASLVTLEELEFQESGVGEETVRDGFLQGVRFHSGMTGPLDRTPLAREDSIWT
jgi:hypothetical protein